MKKKILFISLIIMSFTCSCQKDTLKNIVVKEKEQADIIPEETIKEEIPKEENSSSTNQIINQSNQKNDQIETSKTEVAIEETKPIDNSPDENSLDYPIHKGRIDCRDDSECIDISLPIQFKFKDLITNTFYLEVLSKNNQVLGYFIEYIFKEYQYNDSDSCETIGSNIKKDLNEKVASYECTEDNTLKIITNY